MTVEEKDSIDRHVSLMHGAGDMIPSNPPFDVTADDEKLPPDVTIPGLLAILESLRLELQSIRGPFFSCLALAFTVPVGVLTLARDGLSSNTTSPLSFASAWFVTCCGAYLVATLAVLLGLMKTWLLNDPWGKIFSPSHLLANIKIGLSNTLPTNDLLQVANALGKSRRAPCEKLLSEAVASQVKTLKSMGNIKVLYVTAVSVYLLCLLAGTLWAFGN